jgi:peptide/nickel transport system permease protein
MTAYIARRFAQSMVILLGITLLTFVLLHLIPGGPAHGILGPRATPPQIAAYEQATGLNRPVVQQYLVYLNHLLHGNFGYSYKLNQTVASVLAQDLPKSLALVGPPTVLSLVIGIPLGLWQAQRRDKLDDHLITGVGYTLYAMPDFWLAYILIDIFALRLFWLPPNAPSSPTWTAAFTDAQAMILPWATLTLVSVAVFSRYMRSSALDSMSQDYIRTARAKGAQRGRVLRRHVIRNASIPIITLVGLSIPGLLSGAILEEVVFNYPGIGLATYNAALVKDYPILLGTTIVFGALTIAGNLIADIAYAYADPRVRLS